MVLEVIIIIHTPGKRHLPLTMSIIVTAVVHEVVTIAIIVAMAKIPKRYCHVDERPGRGLGLGPELDPYLDQDLDRARGSEIGGADDIHGLDQDRGLGLDQGLVEQEGEQGLDQDRDRGPDL